MTASSQNGYRRVVVTGLGVVSSLGIGWQEFWKNLIAGKSGISRISSFDTSGYNRHYAGEIKNFDPSIFLSKQKIASTGRASQLAIAAAKLAVRDADFDFDILKVSKMAVCIGTTVGELRHLELFHDYIKSKSKVDKSEMINAFPSNSLSASIAREFGLRGWNSVMATACSAGNYAIGYTYEMIKHGKINFGLAGGSDSFSRVVFTGFSRLYSIAEERCQPFDKNRQGMIPAEGAGVLFLESLDSAIKRSAPIYAEIIGYGLSCDGQHMTIPTCDAVIMSIKGSLESAGVQSNAIDYISAHGTGTSENDKVECAALENIFGSRLKKIPVSGIKSMLGHTMGAASAIEAIGCCLSIKTAKIPPTINFETFDPDCNIDCVPNKFASKKVCVALNNAQAFGGNNSCLVIRKYA